MSPPLTEGRFDTRSRFDGWKRWQAALMLVAVVVVILVGIFGAGSDVAAPHGEDENHTDSALYSAIVERVQHGENYYTAAVTEHQLRGYPIRPAMTVREPTLAYFSAALGARPLVFALIALGSVTWVASSWGLERAAPGRKTWWAAAASTGLASSAWLIPGAVLSHEVWAALLILLALMIRTSHSYLPSVIVALLAVAFRELAFPLFVVMAIFAWRETKRREAMVWLSALTVFAMAYAAHVVAVDAQPNTGFVESPGWVRFGGWQFLLSTVRESSGLLLLPSWVVAVAVPLAVLGWASRPGQLATRVSAILVAYGIVFMAIGRPENWYWGQLYVPLMGAGLAFSPSALGSLRRQIRRPSGAVLRATRQIPAD